MFQYGFSYIMEYPKTCKAISITIVILRILALSYLIYVLSIATTPTNHPYETNVTLLSWPTFRYEDAFRIDVLLFNISIGQAAVLLVVDFLLLYGSFRQIPQFLNAWGSCNITLLIYDIIIIIQSGGLTPIFIIKLIIIGLCLYFVFQTAREWQR